LGAFLLDKLESMGRRCSSCKHLNLKHIDMFYSSDRYVRIWAESRVHQEVSEEQEGEGVRESLSGVMEEVFSRLAQEVEKAQWECWIECG
jgi:GTPase SAR1 family protein